jgi:titin
MMNWLQADVAATTQQWLIAFWHHPPYSKGSHNSDTETELIEMRNYALPILEAFGVDLVFCGHSHSYERTVLLDGHYGLSTTLSQNMKKNAGSGREDSADGAYQKPAGLSSRQGAVYTVAGASGQTSGGALNHPAMFISANVLGSMVLDVNSNRVDAVYLGTNGVAVDHFTLIKTVAPPPLPAAPSGLTAVALSSSEIELSWTDNAVNEQGFALERSFDGINFAPLATVGANVTNGVEIGLSAATTYYYRVYAFNDSGASGFSSVASATTSGPMPPPAPTGLSATPGDNLVVLLWYVTANATNYNVHRTDQSGGPYVQIASGVSSASFTDSNALNGHIYYYVVSGVGEAGEGPYSAEVSATPNPPPPAIPSGIVAVAGDSRVALSWNAATSADSYSVKRSDVTGGPYVAVATNVNATNYNDLAVVNGATFYYVISAVNPGGKSSNSVEVAAFPLATPAVPNNFRATGGDNIVLLSWEPAANATTYRLRRAIENGTFQQLAIVATTSYSDTSVSNGTSYRYVLAALNGSVESAETAAIVGAPVAPRPAAPTGLTAAPGDAQIELQWNGSLRAMTYGVKRSLDSGGPYSVVTVGVTATNFSDMGLINGTTYFYVVSASNGSGESPDSSEASATPLAPPFAPSGLNAAPISTAQIDLSWLDNSLVETSFEVEQSTDGASFVLVNTLAADSTTLSVTGLSTATAYYFRVRAVNAGGASEYSSIASATTFDVSPSTPANFSATTVSASQIDLAWSDTANNETGFTAELSTDAVNFSLLATLGANTISLSATSLTANTTHYFRVRAFNAYGSSSNVTASATTLPLLPAAPTGVSAVATNNKVTLTWNFVPGATSYRVKRSLSSGGPFSNIATVTTNTYANTGLNNGTQYFYLIAAVSAVGAGPDSAVVSATPQAPPSAPTSLSISSISQTQLNLTWKDNSRNELGFKIERALTSSGPFTQIATVGANVRSFADTGLQRDTRYYYRVRAYHAAGDSAYSGTSSGRTKI